MPDLYISGFVRCGRYPCDLSLAAELSGMIPRDMPSRNRELYWGSRTPVKHSANSLPSNPPWLANRPGESTDQAASYPASAPDSAATVGTAASSVVFGA